MSWTSVFFMWGWWRWDPQVGLDTRVGHREGGDWLARGSPRKREGKLVSWRHQGAATRLQWESCPSDSQTPPQGPSPHWRC